MALFNPDTFTFGCEVNLPDVEKSTVIPARLGSWEYAEVNMVNVIGENWGRAVDPLGISPTVGGEFNLTPDTTPEAQTDKIMELYSLVNPSLTMLDAHHVHVRVPGLLDDVDALKRLAVYVGNNSQWVYDNIRLNNFVPTPQMKKDGAWAHFRNSSGYPMPSWMADNLSTLTTDHEHYHLLHRCGKDGVSVGRPSRYIVNTYTLGHIETIEMRCFRLTWDRDTLLSHIEFTRDFVDAAINYGPDVEELVANGDYKFAEMLPYDSELFQSFKKTKHSGDRGKKVRKLIIL